MKKFKKLLALSIGTVLLASSLAGCGSKPAEQPAATDTKTEAPADDKAPADTASGDAKKFVLIVKSTGNPYNEKEAEGFKAAIEEAGAGEVILKAPAEPTAEAQIQMIEEAIAQKVTVIALAGNDPDALQPVLTKAMKAGIKVLSLDSSVNAASRMVHVNQADPERIGRVQVQAMAEMIGGKGQIAVLSATSQAANQNLWIEWMKKELEDPKYKDIELVKVAYGDDLRDKSTSETEALLKAYPDLKGIISPTTVGMAAAGKVLTDKGLSGKVKLTGLGLPSEMAEYITNGVCPWMYLWNPIDVGYLGAYSAMALADGTITGKEGDKFTAGRLGEKTVITAGDGTEIMLGDPFKFEPANIEEWKSVY
ncbi:MAG: rhaS [Clostridia bacterium]|jgi:rhamnose transport system substrate-binding protein|nr:rhaS [Clostridia bacterium]